MARIASTLERFEIGTQRTTVEANNDGFRVSSHNIKSYIFVAIFEVTAVAVVLVVVADADAVATFGVVVFHIDSCCSYFHLMMETTRAKQRLAQRRIILGNLFFFNFDQLEATLNAKAQKNDKHLFGWLVGWLAG